MDTDHACIWWVGNFYSSIAEAVSHDVILNIFQGEKRNDLAEFQIYCFAMRPNWGWTVAGAAVCSVSWICVAAAACHPLRAIQRAAKILPALPPATAPGVHRWTHGWRRTNWAAPQKSPGCPWRCPCSVHGTNVFAIPCLYFVGIMLSAVHHRTRSS